VRTAWEIAGLLAAGAVPNLAYLAIGLWLLRPLRLAARGAERWALAFVLGTGVASLGILLLRAFDVPIPLLALAAVAALGLPRLGSRDAPARDPRPAPPWVRAVDTAALAAALLTVAAALGPETSWDGLEYHLPMVQAWSQGPIRALPAMLDAEFRAAVDLLYLPAVAAGQPDGAAVVSAGFALALAALVRAEATRRASPGAGALAGLFVLLVPFVLDSAPTTYVDLGVGAYGFLALLFADRWNRTGEPRTLFVSALCLGFAANAKLHALVLCPAALAVVALGGRRPPWRPLAGCAAVIAALVAPWFAKLAATTGNPCFPFLGEWFGYGPTSAELLSLRRYRLSTDFWVERELGGFVRRLAVERDVAGFLRYLASIHFGRNPHLSGLIGPLPLALAPLALHRPSRRTAVLAGTLAVLFVLQFVYMPALRFGAPLLPFAAVAAAVGGARLARSGSAARAVLGLALALLATYHGAAMSVRFLPRVAALRAPRAYEREIFPDQVALREVVSRAEPVVAIPMGAVFWMPKPVYNLLWERNGELFFIRESLHWERNGEPVSTGSTPPREALALLKRRGVRSLAIDVEPPHPRDGRVGHPIVDAWLREGLAALREDGDPPSARGHRVWVLVELE
jgi:hypothetical protein